jgi:hypothetical protein
MYVLLFHDSRLNQQSAISNQRSARELNHKGHKGMKVFGTRAASICRLLMKKAWVFLKGKYQILNTKYPFFEIVAVNGLAGS